MPYSHNNPVVAALRQRDADPCLRPQVANGTTAMKLPPGNEAARLTLAAAWLPLMTGQAVPMIGERVDGESCWND